MQPVFFLPYFYNLYIRKEDESMSFTISALIEFCLGIIVGVYWMIGYMNE